MSDDNSSNWRGARGAIPHGTVTYGEEWDDDAILAGILRRLGESGRAKVVTAYGGAAGNMLFVRGEPAIGLSDEEAEAIRRTMEDQ